MNWLEIECSNKNCNCDCTIGQTQHQNSIFTTDLKLNKEFTCDDCGETILIVDKELMNVAT